MNDLLMLAVLSMVLQNHLICWLTNPFWATCPWFPWVGLFIAVLSASSRQVDYMQYFYQCSILLTLLSLLHSMFYKAFHCPWNHPVLDEFICLFICHFFPHVHTIIDNLTSALIPCIVGKLKLSSTFIFTIQLNVCCLLYKRCCSSSLHRGQHLLAWSKVPLTNYHIIFHASLKRLWWM